MSELARYNGGAGHVQKTDNDRHAEMVARGGRKSADVVIHTGRTAMAGMGMVLDRSKLARPDAAAAAKTAEDTAAALGLIAKKKKDATKTTALKGQDVNRPQVMKYTTSTGPNSQTRTRLLQIHEVKSDPMIHFQMFKKPNDPAVKEAKEASFAPVLRSPTKKMTAKDKLDWTVPPCISNHKNRRGYMISLDMRQAADASRLTNVTPSDRHASFADSMAIGRRKLAEDVALRQKIQREKKENERRVGQEELLLEAQRARDARAASLATESHSERESRMRREDELQRAEDDRLRLNRGSSSSSRPGPGRDLHEQVALGAPPVPKAAAVRYDQRLFNLGDNLAAGFGAEDEYNVYDTKFDPMARVGAREEYRPSEAAIAEAKGKSGVADGYFVKDTADESFVGGHHGKGEDAGDAGDDEFGISGLIG